MLPRLLYRAGVSGGDPMANGFGLFLEKRHKGDYNDFFDFDEETVLRLYPLS